MDRELQLAEAIDRRLPLQRDVGISPAGRVAGEHGRGSVDFLTDKTFRFLFVGGSVARKGIDWLIHAYTQEFARDEDVCLVVKDLGTKTFYRYGNYRELLLQAARDTSIPEGNCF